MAVGPGGIMYMPQNRPQRASGNLGGALSSPFAGQIQQLAAQLGGGGGAGLNGFVPPAPNLAPGTYSGPYAAQGLRTSNPMQAAQLWESRHPGQVHAGNIPGWVTQGLMSGMPHPGHPGGQMDPHQVLQDVVSAHRQANGLEPMHPEDLHGRVTALAHEILNSRGNRARRALRGILPPTPMPPSGPAGGPFTAS